jgi:hypothetical protein
MAPELKTDNADSMTAVSVAFSIVLFICMIISGSDRSPINSTIVIMFIVSMAISFLMHSYRKYLKEKNSSELKAHSDAVLREINEISKSVSDEELKKEVEVQLNLARYYAISSMKKSLFMDEANANASLDSDIDERIRKKKILNKN